MEVKFASRRVPPADFHALENFFEFGTISYTNMVITMNASDQCQANTKP